MKNNKQIFNELKKFKIHIDDVPFDFWSNEDFIYKLLDTNEEVFKFFKDEKKNSREFVIKLITENKCYGVYEFLNDLLKDDNEIVNMCIDFRYNIDYVPEKYKLDDAFIKKTLLNTPMKFCYFPESVKDNIEYVKLAIKNEGVNLIHASDTLRCNIDLIYESTYLSKEPNSLVLEELGEKLKKNIPEIKKLIDKYLKNHKANEYLIDSLVKEIDDDIKTTIVEYIDSKNVYKDKIWDTKKIIWDQDFSHETEETVERKGEEFIVKFIIESLYEDETENISVVTEREYHSSNIDDLFALIEDDINNDIIDDSICLNHKSKSHLINTNIEYIEIKDKENNIVYQDKN